MDKKIYFSILAALLTIAFLALLAALAAPVVRPLAWALIIGTATIPHHNHLLERFPGHPDRSAGLMVLAVTICLVIPTAGLIVTAAINAPEWYRQVEQLIQSFSRTGSSAIGQFTVVQRAMDLVERFGIDLGGIGGKMAAASSTFILNSLTSMARNLFDSLFTLTVTLFVLFFIYRDGERVVSLCVGRLAPNPRKAQYYATKIRSITTAVAVGTILTCVTQGVLAGLGYWVAGVPAPVFCGALTAIAALIPVVGTAIVWVPLAGLIALNGEYLTAALLALWCVFFVGFSDNAIRPLAIGASGDVSVLAVVLGAICGVVTIGMLGLILGPLVFAIIFSMWHDVVAHPHAAEEGEIP